MLSRIYRHARSRSASLFNVVFFSSLHRVLLRILFWLQLQFSSRIFVYRHGDGGFCPRAQLWSWHYRHEGCPRQLIKLGTGALVELKLTLPRTLYRLWSCFSTIFLSTWTAFHQEVPKKPGDNTLADIIFSAGAVFFVPELFVAIAASEFVQAWSLRKEMRTIKDWESFSLKQAFLVVVGGVSLSTTTAKSGDTKTETNQNATG